MMATFLQQNFGTIVTLIVAFVPFFVTVLTLLGSQPEKIKAPLDTRIKVRKIERIAVGEETWKELSIIEMQRAMKIIAFSILVFILLWIFHDFIDLLIIILIIILMVLNISTTVVNIIFSPYKYRSKDYEVARFYVFQDAIIIVEAKFDYIFAKAQEAIIGKHIKYIEANAEDHTIHAYHDGDITTTQGTISVKIHKENEGKDCYAIVIDYTPSPHNFINSFTQVISISPSMRGTFAYPLRLLRKTLEKTRLTTLIAWISRSPTIEAKTIEEKAKIINHFLNKFLATTTAK
jgi:hypothetical protein